MAIIRARSNEIHCKIVYYGPGRGGKTTNLITLHKAVENRIRSELISINTAGDRTIFFDFLPMDLGMIRDFRIKFSVYTVPGQVRYNDTRKLVLRGADGLVFVADSLNVRKRQNVESLMNLHDNLQEIGANAGSIPLVLQFNKRDLSDQASIMPTDEMNDDLNPSSQFPWFEASALVGYGVKQTFKTICMLTVTSVGEQLMRDLSTR
jgi:signal recognition particle receptor subunit beta